MDVLTVVSDEMEPGSKAGIVVRRRWGRVVEVGERGVGGWVFRRSPVTLSRISPWNTS